MFPGPKYRFQGNALEKKIKGQFGVIRSQQDELSSQAGELMERRREIARVNTLLAEKTMECEALKTVVSSLEFALREETQTQ